ncbi:MAG: radical SAM protein [bacterium]
MKRVLLINTNIEKSPYPIPPLGICLLASYIEPYYEVKVYDGVFDEGRSLVNFVAAFQPDYIGFSIRNIDDVVADKEVFYIDRILSDFIQPVMRVSSAPVILGGSGFSVFPPELMQLSGADYGIVGEAEELFLDLLQKLDQGLVPEAHPRLWRKRSRDAAGGMKSDFLRYDLVPFSDIDKKIDFAPYMQRGVYSIQTKRGCALKCVYCTYPCIEGKTYRLRDPEEIAREIEEVVARLGRVMIEFVDSTFNEPKGHAEAICHAIIKLRLKVNLRTMGVNPRNTGREFFELMKEAGFVQIDATPDSASPTVIRNLRKGFSVADIRRSALLIREFNLPTMWFFLFGGPGETEETVGETREFIREFISPEDMVLMLAGLRIYPNTPLEKIALKEGVIKPGQSLFRPSPYYFSEFTPKKSLNQMISAIADEFHNCLPALDSTPSTEILQKATHLRNAEKLTEPMFRTLLRVRRDEGRET